MPDRPPRFPPGPWTPFGPTDDSILDAPSVVAGAEALRARLVKTREHLERIRRGGVPDVPDDRHPHEPPAPPRRSEMLLPFLVIRTQNDDTGARPFDAALWTFDRHQSPDIILTTRSTTDPPAVGRAAFNTTLAGRIVGPLNQTQRYDVWVHVWNLGRAPAYGVRLRAWSGGSGRPNRSVFIGGRQFDLGDRNSPNSHLVVKVGSWGLADGGAIVATAECILDVANGTHDWSQDRHTATRDMWAVPIGPPPVTTVPP